MRDKRFWNGKTVRITENARQMILEALGEIDPELISLTSEDPEELLLADKLLTVGDWMESDRFYYHKVWNREMEEWMIEPSEGSVTFTNSQALRLVA
jgi:hypothetical protein